jgi:cyanophycin synthetase
MQIRHVNALTGPNVWANFAVLEATVDLGRYEELPTNLLPGCADRLTEWLPSLIEHRCGIGERGGFLQRLREGTWLGHVLEHVTLELESLAHLPVGFGRARSTGEPGVYKVVVRCEEPAFGEACLASGRELVLAAAEGRDFPIASELRRLRELADRICLGPSTQAIVSAARERGIPSIRLSSGNLVQLGYGKAQRRIWTAETDGTAAIAESIAQDKELTRTLLRSVGVAVPAGRKVTGAEDAWAAANELGVPVVVKPQDGNHGRGVSIRLEDRASVEQAFRIAANEGSGVVVERFVPGAQYRVLVVGDRAIAASGGDADQLLGDGVHSVAELVALANQDPSRGEDSAQLLTTLVLDDISLELLHQQGLTAASVPAQGRVVLIRYNGDLTVDVTDRLHADVASSCVLAAQTIGLDIAGIDLIAQDISRPLEAQGGAVIEVNASPGLVMHLKPLHGQPRPVGEAIIGHVFGSSQSGRVPLVAVAGSRRAQSVATLLGRLLVAAGYHLGQADTEGVRVGDHWLSRGDTARAAGCRRLLMNPFANAFLFQVPAESVLTEGLAFDRCQVAVVTDVDEPQPLPDGSSPSLHWRALRAAADVVLPTGVAVLNADDPNVVRMAEHTKGRVVYVGENLAAQPLAAHLAAGGVAVVAEAGRVFVCRGDAREELLDVETLSSVRIAGASPTLSDWLSALAACQALGMTLEAVRSTFFQERGGRPVPLPERAAGAVASAG